MFTVTLDSKVFMDSENTAPEEFEDVKVYFGDNFYNSPESAKIKNVVISSNYIGNKCQMKLFYQMDSGIVTWFT